MFKGTLFSTGDYSAEYGQALSAVMGLNSIDPASPTLGYTNLALCLGLTAPGQGWEQAPQRLGGSVRLAHRAGQSGVVAGASLAQRNSRQYSQNLL